MRIPTGIKEMDALTDGGFPANTVVLLSGSAGAGKTLVGLNFAIKGALANEKSCFISFNESKADLARACEGIGLSIEDKNLVVKNIVLGKDTNLNSFLKRVEKYPKMDRIVIDNVNKLLLFAENNKDYRYQLCNLVRYLREKANCSVLICESEGDKVDTGNGEAFECDGVISLSISEFEEKPFRTLRIEKLRYTPIEPKVAHELIINSKGLRLSKKKMI